METIRRPSLTWRIIGWLSLVLMYVAVILAIVAKPAHASAPVNQPAPVTYTVTYADLIPQVLAQAATTAAQPGEGVIRITTRICGNADNWQAVAAANNIVAWSNPPYLVLLGQVLTVSCSGASGGIAPSTPVQPVAPAGTGWTNPLPGACLGSPFGEWRGSYTHMGLDLPDSYGAPIHAAAAGTVSVGWQAGGAGNYTMINHGGGIWTVYMHQSRFTVTSGWVGVGQVIGYVGSTGDSSVNHLHFEVHTGGLWNNRVNPVTFMANHGVHLGC